MPDDIRELLATDSVIGKLGARSISIGEAEQVLAGGHRVVRNVRGDRSSRADRRLLIGRTSGGRWLTLVVEATLEPTSWLLVTGWESTAPERKIGAR